MVETQQQPSCLIYIHTVLSDFNLLRQLIHADVLTIEEHLHKTAMVRVRHAHPTCRLKRHHIHHVGHVAIIGKQVPVLCLVQSEQFALRVEFELIGLLVIPFPTGVATSADTSCARIVRVLALAIQGEMAIEPNRLVHNRSLLFSHDAEGEDPVLVVPFLLISQAIGESDAVQCLHTERHHDFLAILIQRIGSQCLILREVELRVLVNLQRHRPRLTAISVVHLHPFLGTQHPTHGQCPHR